MTFLRGGERPEVALDDAVCLGLSVRLWAVFGAIGGPRPSADGPAFPTKTKTFCVIKYLNIYPTNK